MAKGRKANHILYVFENGFRYTDLPIEEWIPIHETHYIEASEKIREIGFKVNGPESDLEHASYLLDGHLVELGGISQIQGSRSTRTIRISTEEELRSSRIEKLVEKLGLPLPR